MAAFDKDDYLNDLPDADAFGAPGQAAPAGASASADNASASADADEAASDGASAAQEAGDGASAAESGADNGAGDAAEGAESHEADSVDGKLTPLGQAKKEAAEYLEALQRERAEFINYRNRTAKDMDRARQQGIIDVLNSLLPALDDIDRIREHGEMDDSFKAVAAKIDKTFEKFGVEKFGIKGEEFDPTRHDAILHKPDSDVDKPMVDTVVEAGYRIGDRVVRPARVVVASPQS